MQDIGNPQVLARFQSYPESIQAHLLSLRQLIIESAQELEGDSTLEETLKWGEPSYLMKGGSTLRIDWKRSSPNQYAMYFHCQTKLVDTFKELYGDKLQCSGNRAIIFHENDTIPREELKHCIQLSLTYHKIKHLPMLGA